MFQAGDPLVALYVVREGYFKTCRTDGGEREHVLGFHMPGELIGLDAIWLARHGCDAVALGKAVVCELPYSRLTELAREVPELQHTILRLISMQLVHAHSLAGDHSAEERVAGFLISISARMKARGNPESQFMLMMPRRDIANYLRLATATVSRVLSRFEADGLLSVSRRKVMLRNLDGIRALAHRLSGAVVHELPLSSITSAMPAVEPASPT